MKCGHCHEQHETVAEVKVCYGIDQTTPTAQLRPNHYPGDCARCGGYIEANKGHIDKSTGIWRVLHNEPCEPKSVAPAQVTRVTNKYKDIPEGRYAVKSLTGHNDLDFFKVNRPTEGKWKGFTFVQRVIGGRPDVAVKGETKGKALEAILAAGPDQAMALFGQTLGYCGRCGRHLTDEESRAVGIGPVCRAA